MSSFSNKNRIALLTLSIIIAAGVTFSLYLYYRGVAEDQVRIALIEQQEKTQNDYTKSLSEYVGSDLDSIIRRLELLASKPQLQRGELTGEETKELLEQARLDINEITVNDGIVLLNQDNIVTISTNYPEFVGVDASFRDYIKGAKQNLEPVISEGSQGRNGKFGIGIAVPIINDENGEYVGMLVGALVSQDFLSRYGNILEIDSQLITALDKNGAYLILPSGSDELVGKNFFSEEIQNRINGNQELNAMYTRAVKEGGLASTLFDTGSGERFAVAAPVFYQGQQVMTVVTSTPTASIYSQTETILAAQKVQSIIFIIAFAMVVGGVVAFLLRWNSALDKSVKAKTMEIKEANNQLVDANEKLRVSEALQREFINIAAHELRTPIQPILGAAELLEQQFTESNKEEVNITRAEVDLLVRNAKRLERLSSDILQVSKIESNRLVLQKERINLNEKIRNVVKDTETVLIAAEQGGKVIIKFEPATDPIEVDIDRTKIYEVISNLLRNAIKFTRYGTILVTSETLPASFNEGIKGEEYALVKVKDPGSGIDPEIFPKLFSKFATKSEQGTGLGLFISKSIVEAHGGRIWAENNNNGAGATFAFTLPIIKKQSVPV